MANYSTRVSLICVESLITCKYLVIRQLWR